MAELNFEGDIANVSERQLQFIYSVIQELGLEKNKIHFEPVGKAGDNYVASVKRITIDGVNGCMKIIAKIAPTLEPVRQAMNTAIMFKNEHTMYAEVLPKFVQFQKDAEIPENEHLRYAKYYGSLLEQPNEVILLEDLSESDYIMLDRFKPLPEDCVKSVLKNFAIIHSLAFVLKSKEHDMYSNFKKKLTDTWLCINKVEEVNQFFDALENDTLAILEDQKHIDFLKNKVTNIVSAAEKCSKIDNTSKYTVIQQGDSWTNNIMFRFENEKLEDSIMIDYQISKNTSPVCDIMYMIFNCTDHATRINKFYDWIDYYHLELDKSLSNFNLKANFVFPRDILDADLKRYSKFLFGMSVLLASILIRKPDDAAKVKFALNEDNMKADTPGLLVSSLDEDTKTRFKNRVIGLIESFTQLGLL